MVSQLLDGRYQIIEVIERGEFGQTYLARDTRRPGEPQCFVKHLRPAHDDLNLINTARRLFEKEAEVLEKLGQHDQIPQLYAYFEENQEFYLVEAFIEGHSLASEILPGHPLSEEQVTTIIKEVLEILVFVHSHGVIHRDIKPGNLIRRYSDSKLVLSDFGSVKEIHAVQQQRSPLVRVGSVEYMPIEQFQYNPQLNSDIYAVGMMAIQALTGLPTCDLPKLKNSQKDSEERDIIWRHLAVVSQDLADVIDNMVRADYRQRYQSASEALADLKRIGDLSRSRLPKLTVYREEVERRASYRGEITVVGRKILDELRESLELSKEETEIIEDEVLNPYRKYQEKGQRYEQALVEALQQEFPLSQETLGELKRLQQVLGLTEEDTAKIEDRVIPQSLLLKVYTGFLMLFKRKIKKPSPRLTSELNGATPPVSLNGQGAGSSSVLPQGKFPLGSRQLRFEEWQLLGMSVAVVLLLLGVGYGYWRWQKAQEAVQQEDLAEFERVNALYVAGNYEACVNLGGGTAGASSQLNQMQELIDQCEAGLNWQQVKMTDLSRHQGAVGTLTFSPDGKQLISGSRDQTIGVWDVETGTRISRFQGDGSPIWSVKVTPDGTQLVAGTFDWRILVWDMITGNQLLNVEHTGPVWSVDLSDQGPVIVSGSGDRTVKIWELATGNLIYTLPDNTASVFAVAVSPDGNTLVTGSQDQTINILDIPSGDLLKTLRGHTDAVRDIAITPDGRQIVSGSYDRTLKIWDLATGELIKTLEGHQDAIVAVAISPDGKMIASGGRDATIRLWDTATGELITILAGHTDEVYALTFSPDGKTLASGSKDQTIKLWRR